MLMTGRYFALHVGDTGGGGLSGTNGVPLAFTFIPMALQSAGYHTYFLGKWHLGQSSFSQSPKSRGFNRSLFYFGGQEDYYSKAGELKDCDEPVADWWQSSETVNGPATTIDGWNTTYSLYLYNDRGVQYITEHPVDEPMFFYFASQNIHDPHQVWPRDRPPRFLLCVDAPHYHFQILTVWYLHASAGPSAVHRHVSADCRVPNGWSRLCVLSPSSCHCDGVSPGRGGCRSCVENSVLPCSLQKMVFVLSRV
jgi:arylsulfatase A-like enzyme